ncbi:MAG: 50S ribosomal protein L4 [Spirochaetia bacterium]|nr:50S ribosomal protein L4 [Spirochaetia bacterium]
MKLDVLDKENKKVSEVEVAESYFDIKVKDDVIHDVVLAYQQNQHTGSSNTLTRAEVAGGGRKPWKQKHTGQARHGSIRSPIWKGGGVTFGPRPFKSRITVNKIQKAAAMQAVIGRKLKDGDFIVLNEMPASSGKTKEIAALLKNFKADGSRVLLVIRAADKKLMQAARNINKLTVISEKNLNVYELLTHPKVLVTKTALEEIIKRKG